VTSKRIVLAAAHDIIFATALQGRVSNPSLRSSGNRRGCKCYGKRRRDYADELHLPLRLIAFMIDGSRAMRQAQWRT
jgi:hypothetical protein